MSDTSQIRDIDALLEFLRDERGFDLTGYKRATLRRRIDKRVQATGAADYARYMDYLEANPREFTDLFNTILINVTSFFRDEEAWEYLAKDVVPKLVEEIPKDKPVRVWSAGCASGEEAYTAAMVFAETMGIDEFCDRVKIYATDLDDDALAEARHAVYANNAFEGVPEPLIEKYFEPNSRGLAFRNDLRRSVIFGRNDLVADAPISRIDLLLCRNVLMYFTRETQERILERFNFALNPDGYLFLGKSEMLLTHGSLFVPHHLKWRVFKKVPRDNLRERLVNAVSGDRVSLQIETNVRDLAAAMSPVAQIVVNRAGFLEDANARARQLFSLGAADIGRPFQDLALSYRPTDLRSAIETAYEQAGLVQVGRVEFARAPGEDLVLEIDVAPVTARDGSILGATVMFNDVTALARLAGDYAASKRELETAYEELQSTVEELETTNEELQSTNEELETTNEELQSTNEELETMNEELQSTNDELEHMNHEVTSRATELERVSVFLEGILGSLGMGVAVVDTDRSVQIWNAEAQDLWGLRAGEVEGKDFLSLDMGLPVSELAESLTAVLDGRENSAEQVVPARNRRGRDFACRVKIMRLTLPSGAVYGAVVLTGPDSASA
jgi:two-component system CheB/CheR fusion protein